MKGEHNKPEQRSKVALEPWSGWGNPARQYPNYYATSEKLSKGSHFKETQMTIYHQLWWWISVFATEPLHPYKQPKKCKWSPILIGPNTLFYKISVNFYQKQSSETKTRRLIQTRSRGSNKEGKIKNRLKPKQKYITSLRTQSVKSVVCLQRKMGSLSKECLIYMTR